MKSFCADKLRLDGKTSITAGSFRNRNLYFDSRLVRPTLSRLRKTLFDWIGNDLYGMNCLDAFAGSGALGIEALSRRAKNLVFVEKNPKVALQLKRTISSFKIQNAQIYSESVWNFLHRSQDRFDLIFLDPPFDLIGEEFARFDYQEMFLKKLKSKGLIYLESPKQLFRRYAFDFFDLTVLRQKSFGNIIATLIKFGSS